METKPIAVTVAGLLCIFALAVYPQSTPAPVTADPVVDKQFPPQLATLTIPSHGVAMDAFFYLASGSAPHSTVILLHGLPGYEMNEDLAQSIRRAGWNVLLDGTSCSSTIEGRGELRERSLCLQRSRTHPRWYAFCASPLMRRSITLINGIWSSLDIASEGSLPDMKLFMIPISKRLR